MLLAAAATAKGHRRQQPASLDLDRETKGARFQWTVCAPQPTGGFFLFFLVFFILLFFFNFLNQNAKLELMRMTYSAFSLAPLALGFSSDHWQ